MAAIHFGRGLQSVNILRNRAEDTRRGVDFFPSGWVNSRCSSTPAKISTRPRPALPRSPNSPSAAMVDIPLALAEATLQALENGQSKLTRSQVMQIVGQSIKEKF